MTSGVVILSEAKDLPHLHFLVAEGDHNPKARQESIHVEWQSAPGESHHATLTSPLHWHGEPAQSLHSAPTDSLSPDSFVPRQLMSTPPLHAASRHVVLAQGLLPLLSPDCVEIFLLSLENPLRMRG